MPEGYIKKGIGGFYYVQCGDELLECKAKGIFRKRGITPVAGDRVTVEVENGGNVIAEIAPRRNVFVRPPIANLDVLFIVASTTQPVPSTLVLDKLTAIAVDKEVQPVLVFTKGDLASTEKLTEAYALSTLPVVVIDHATGGGLEEIKNMIQGKLCAFCGNSGAGKSTLLNAIDPRLALSTGDISQKLGRGRHTTRHVELFELPQGGYVADTPGFSAVDLEKFQVILKDELAGCFREMRPYEGKCRFTGCSHTKEKGCAVLEAVQEGKIAPSRHQSYVALYEQAKNIKEWEIGRETR